MSTLKMIRELRRQAAEMGARITYRTSAKGHMRATATFDDGRKHVFTIVSSPTDADVTIARLVRELRKFKDGRA